MKNALILITCIILNVSTALIGQQVPDKDYNPQIKNPAYDQGKGPVIFIDEGHCNFHTREGRYLPFARLLERDGYWTVGYRGTFEERKLSKSRILVISNALNEADTSEWSVPGKPAFTSEEIEEVRNWVDKGGSLFLIADHMPMGGAAKGLAAAFGFNFNDGYAVDTTWSGAAYFCRKAGTLTDNIITNGRNASERVDTVVTFTGQALTIPDDAISILKFRKNSILLVPDTPGVINRTTPRINIENWSQVAFKKYGKGRVAVSGEAAMFTAQLAGPDKIKMGMNSPYAKENYQLLLNIIHWLDKLIE
jgi:hypothetical protein